MSWVHLVLVFALVAAWGFNWVVVTVCLEGLPPLFLAFTRFFLTSVPAIFIVRAPIAPIGLVVAYGLVMFTIQYAFLFFGIYVGLPPGLASILIQFQVFSTLLFALLFCGEKLHRWQVVGAFVSFCGIAVVGLNIKGDVALLGALLILGAAISWSAGNVISKKMGDVNRISLVVWASLVAWPPLLATTLAFEGVDKIADSLSHLSWISAAGIVYITLVSTVFGFGVWSFLLHRHSLTKIAPFTLLVPLVAMFSSVLILGEALHTWKIVAGALILIGLAITMLSPIMRGPSKVPE